MKKGLVVLLIAVLALGAVFADLSGTVTSAYTFNFDNETVDYGVSGTNAELTWTWTSQNVGSTGSEYPYATVKVDLKATTTVGKNAISAWEWTKDGYSLGLADPAFNLKVTLSEFKIVGEEWSVNFLKAVQFGDYAKSAWEIDNTSDKKALDFKNINSNGVEGVTVTYKDIKVGVAARKVADNLGYVIVSSESPKFEFEGGSAQVAGALEYKKLLINNQVPQDGKFGAILSAKADYTVDALSLAVAADTAFDKDDFDADVSVAAAYDPVAVDFYYATKVDVRSKKYADTENIMSVKAVVDVAKVAEDVKVKVTAKAENLLNDAKILDAEAEVAMIENTDLTVGYNDMLGNGTDNKKLFAKATFTGIEDITLKGDAAYSFGAEKFTCGVEADYAAEKYTLVGAVRASKTGDASILFAGRVGATTTAIVDNATLAADLAFNKNNLFGDDFNNANYLKVSCKVAF